MRTTITTALTIAFFFAATTDGDTITLSTGEKLQGKVVKQDDGVVMLEHPILGVLSMPRDDVSLVVIGTPDDSGENPVESSGDGEHSGNGEVSTVNTALHPEEQPAEPLPPESIFEGWDAQLEASFDGSDGNTVANGFRAAFLATRETDNMILKFDASTVIQNSSGDRIAENTTVGLRGEWPLGGSPWFAFAQARYDHDRFKDWEHRASAHGGLGYWFIDNETFRFAGLVGGGGAYEWGGIIDDQLNPEALVGWQADWKVNDRVKFHADMTYFPDLDEIEEGRLVSNAWMEVELDYKSGLALKLGVESEYETQTSPGIKHHDIHYYGALVLKF